MTKKFLLLCCMLFAFNHLTAQQYGLFNTKTLFDGFENPAQKTFLLDSSRQYASNFFLPYFAVNATNKGNGAFIRQLINDKTYNAGNLELGTGQVNKIFQNSNVYLFNFKIFKSYKYHKEIGLSWQVKTDADLRYTNETLAILDTYKRFEKTGGQNIASAFNNNGYAQTYHQFSLSYRENYDKRLAFGVKLSLLSGITYNRLKVTESNFQLDNENNRISVSLNGSYRASFLEGKELSKKDALPLFKNPGLAISMGTTYLTKSGYLIVANIKDLGFIRWNKNSYNNTFNNIGDPVVIEDPDLQTSSYIETKITNIATQSKTRSSFFTPTNAKADFLISRQISFLYTPSLVAAKNLFYRGGDLAFINKFRYNDFYFSAIPDYNFNNLFLFGAQFMYQTPNFEAFLGSDNIFKTSSTAGGLISGGSSVATGYNGASVYLGLSIKFGYTVEHPLNASSMPGIDYEETSFFKRLFSIFKKKK